MTGVKSKKDRPVKKPKENVPLSLEASAISSTLFILSICFEGLPLESKIFNIFRTYCFR